MINRLHGIDGCRAGWVVAESDTSMRGVSFSVRDGLRSLFGKAGPRCIIAIDIPIGLTVSDPRICDIQARKLLGLPRCTSVFPPPARKTLNARTFPEALSLNRKALGTGISKQTFCIMPKIREIDELMTAESQQYIREVHPEVSFAQLNGGPMLHNKKTDAGRAERIGLLNSVGLSVSENWLKQERGRLGRANVALDDLVDALVCLVTAHHVHTGRYHSLGGSGQRDEKKLLMEIVTCEKVAKGARA